MLCESYQCGNAEWVLEVICQGYCLMSHCGREGERGHSRLTNQQYNNILAQSQIRQYVTNPSVCHQWDTDRMGALPLLGAERRLYSRTMSDQKNCLVRSLEVEECRF